MAWLCQSQNRVSCPLWIEMSFGRSNATTRHILGLDLHRPFGRADEGVMISDLGCPQHGFRGDFLALSRASRAAGFSDSATAVMKHQWQDSPVAWFRGHIMVTLSFAVPASLTSGTRSQIHRTSWQPKAPQTAANTTQSRRSLWGP